MSNMIKAVKFAASQQSRVGLGTRSIPNKKKMDNRRLSTKQYLKAASGE